MSGMFDAGAIAFNIRLIGAQLFERDATRADQAVTKLGVDAQTAATKTDKAGASLQRTGKAAAEATPKVTGTAQAVDATGKAAKAADPAVAGAASSTKKLGTEAGGSAPKVRQVTKTVEQLRAESDHARTTVGLAFVGIGAGIATAIGAAVHEFADFDQAMSAVGAASGETGSDLASLRQAAVEAGAATKYSATDAASGEVELAKAGLNAATITGGALAGSLALAAAGGVQVADAAETTATALTLFNLKGDEAGHVADLLAAGAGKAQGGVGDLSQALDQGGLVASQFGISVDDTVGALALFAKNGLIGSDAGTSFKTMLLALATPTKQQTALMEQYNIHAYDQQGNFVGLTKLAGELQDGFKGATAAERDQALGIIFGSDAIRTANVLYKEGADGVRDMTAAVNDNGYAARQAAQMQDNLAGDVEKLGGAFDTALIQTGSGANDALRDMVQEVSELVDWFSGLPDPVQKTALTFGATTAAILLLGGGALTVVPKLRAARDMIAAMGVSGKAASVGLGVGTLAIAALTTALITAKSAYDSTKTSEEEWANSIANSAQADLLFANTLSGVDKSLLATQLHGKDLQALIDTMAQQTNNPWKVLRVPKDIEDHLDVYKSQLNEVGTQLAKLAETDPAGAAHGFQTLAKETDGSQASLVHLLAGMEPYRDALIKQANQQGVNVTTGNYWQDSLTLVGLAMDATTDKTKDGTTATSGFGTAIGKTQDQVDGMVTSISDLIEEYDALNGKNLDARAATRDYKQSLDDFDDAIKKTHPALNRHHTDLNLNSQAGRDQQAALDNIAEAARKEASSVSAASGSYDDYRHSLAVSRSDLLDRIHDLGIQGTAALTLRDNILQIPTNTEWHAEVDTSRADAQIEAFKKKLNALGGHYTVASVGLDSALASRNADGNIYPPSHWANGGLSEHHTAQIARAGAMRIWAEPETGGEAYIPLAQAKRGRSTAILNQVADSFGYDLVPRGASSFADGGIVAPAAGSRTTNVNISAPLINSVARSPEKSARRFGELVRMGLGVADGLED